MPHAIFIIPATAMPQVAALGPPEGREALIVLPIAHHEFSTEKAIPSIERPENALRFKSDLMPN